MVNKNIKVGKPKSAYKDSIALSALHEAGHIVIAKHFNCIVKSSEIDVGYGMSVIDPPRKSNLDDLSWAMIACAGPVMERVNYINDGDFKIVTDSGFGKKDLYVLFLITEKLLCLYVSIVSNMVDKLMLKKKLNKRQIDTIPKKGLAGMERI